MSKNKKDLIEITRNLKIINLELDKNKSYFLKVK